MDEVATVTVGAEAFLQKTAASFCFIFRVSLLVFLQLMQSVREFTLLLIGTVTVLYKLLAQLRLLLVTRLGRSVLTRRLLSGERVTALLGQLDMGVSGRRVNLDLAHHSRKAISY
jgi:hypothetical protein